MDASASQPEPTYRIDHAVDPARYYCCVCERAGTEHWSPDDDYMRQHQQQRHAGEMIEASQGPGPAEDPLPSETLEPESSASESF